MPFHPKSIKITVPFIVVFLLLVISSKNLISQKRTADSLLQVLQTDMPDTERAITIRNLSNAIYKYNPDSALSVAYEGLKYAKRINYKAGISRIYNMIAVILTKTGNFNKALSYYIENLKMEESLQSEDGIIVANINIGIVYVYMLDYEKALQSYAKAHTLLQTFATRDTAYLEDLKYSTNLNIGDAFDKMHQVDSAFVYYNNSLNIAISKKNDYKKGMALLGIANLYAATKEYSLSMANYQTSLRLLSESNDEELACDACLGIAKLYRIFKRRTQLYIMQDKVYIMPRKIILFPSSLTSVIF